MKINPSQFIRITILVAAGFSLLPGELHAQKVAPYLKNTNYVIQLGMYDLFASTQANIVMLGNSLTYNANWSEILNRSDVANRGIASDITSGYLHRLNYIYKLNPKICFIEGGINDLYSNDSVKNIIRNYAAIVDSLQSHDIVPVLQSTLFVSAKYPRAREKNKQVRILNDWLAEFALKNAVEFLNINQLVSKYGFLRDELTYDGIHLTAAGYALWAPEVEKAIVRVEKNPRTQSGRR